MLEYQCLSFDQLSVDQLYDIMALRQEVFVVEQNCPYLDADGLDRAAHHILGEDAQGRILAYTRLLPPGALYPHYATIGRVVTSPRIRKAGLGRELMRYTIACVNQLYDQPDIKISAQSYLIDFYESLGFQSLGEEYLEDGIPHITMIRDAGGAPR